MAQVWSSGNGRILLTWDNDGSDGGGMDESIRWEATFHTTGTIRSDGAIREFWMNHHIKRFGDGRWEVKVERSGNPEPMLLRGDHTVAPVIEADGALIVMLPRGDGMP